MLTVETYKQYVGINSPNQDHAITPVITFVNDFIAKYCNISLTRKNKEETHIAGPASSGYQKLVLRESPLFRVNDIYFGNTFLEEDLDYFVDDEIIYLTRRHPFGRKITVDYSYGYNELPSGILMPAIELVTYFLKREFNKTQSLGVTGESVTFLDPKVVPPHIKAGLDLYRVV